MIPVFSRKPIFGKPAMVGAIVVIFFIGVGVWAHHMFTVGLSAMTNTFFATATMLVGIPTGIKIFNWAATMYGGKIRFATPMLFACGFLLQFLVAGLTGIMLATAPFDWQLHHTYFVVGHFHFTLIGGLVFGLFAGIYYWFPKATGKMFSETLGRLHFWIFLAGFNITFIPMHFAGFLGMPRRVYTYLPGHGLETWNLISTWGVAVQIVGILLFVVNIIWGLWKGPKAGDDPWDAWTLEWATTSPPPEYNFEKIPVVRSGRPLWDLKHPAIQIGNSNKSMAQTAAITADPITIAQDWHLPDRGSVGILMLILTETVLFSDVRGRLYRLYGSEHLRSLSKRCSEHSDPLHHLPAHQQSHHPARPKAL